MTTRSSVRSGRGGLVGFEVQVHLRGAGCGGCPTVDLELAEDVAQAGLHGALTDAQVDRYGLVGPAVKDATEDRPLSRRQRLSDVQLRARTGGGEALHHLAGDRAIEWKAAGAGVFDRPREVLGTAVLEDVAAGSRLQHP